MAKAAGPERARRNALRAMRMANPPLNPTSLARKAGVDVKTVRAFLAGERWPHTDTRSSISRALGLAEDAIDQWAIGLWTAGQEPHDATPSAPTIEDATDLELAVALVARLEARQARAPSV